VLLAPLAAGQYVGSAACGTCHPKQSATQSKSGHARALARAKDRGEWAFGAGDQAITFVSQLNDEFYLEHGLSYYAATRQFDLTPGHRSEAGERYRTFDPSGAILRCFQCHSTGPLRLEEGMKIVPFETGVRCESCHGPGEGHAKGKGAIRIPARTEMNGFCGSCHRKQGADAVNWSDPWNVRHQPLYFAQSECFKKSQEKLSCITCHDPHAPVSRITAEYDKQCAGCHKRVSHRRAVKSNTCVGCHMPDVHPDPKLRFANHWIGVYGKSTLQPIGRRSP